MIHSAIDFSASRVACGSEALVVIDADRIAALDDGVIASWRSLVASWCGPLVTIDDVRDPGLPTEEGRLFLEVLETAIYDYPGASLRARIATDIERNMTQASIRRLLSLLSPEVPILLASVAGGDVLPDVIEEAIRSGGRQVRRFCGPERISAPSGSGFSAGLAGASLAV